MILKRFVLVFIPLLGAGAIASESVLDTPITGAASGSQSFSGAAWGSNAFSVAWGDTRKARSGGPPSVIFAARVSSTGAVLDPSGIETGLNGRASPQDPPAVVWDGANWLVAWQGQVGGRSGIVASRVTPSGVVLDPGGFLVTQYDLSTTR
jgi:hypothetical protein